jgi:hypothetical protein
MPKVKARAIIADCIANGENDQVARWAKEEFVRRGSVLKTERARLVQLLASDELSGPERAETQQKLDKAQAKIMKGPETLKTKRAELQKQLAEQDLAPAVEASLEKELGAVQSKLSAGGNALPWFGLGRLLSQLAAYQPFDRAAPSGCVEPECGSSAGRLG